MILTLDDAVLHYCPFFGNGELNCMGIDCMLWATVSTTLGKNGKYLSESGCCGLSREYVNKGIKVIS
jgi:hypothetical protein